MQQRLYDSTFGCRRLADQNGAGGFETPTCIPAGRATETRGLGRLLSVGRRHVWLHCQALPETALHLLQR